ncbi:hypothetical protein SDRG_01025 [Saprolegnia diclina VS20]|uniref:F-box domain-containing protein n=1 Tax=Saprolegnia diclina (strain VS20) TaxID=1156394 RepID=T0R5H1_SAPDV|nr:hypothetical protein SDRG_01025 [Saprolegnia diclina VS20]EQC42186.1 hypothetical protein SDRG_01025 [Saprolegnia diclina VS20]|eukprot:XP_008604755.1 hypothetical protein SDRG_01025 [Saprolegnia diclina VS20]
MTKRIASARWTVLDLDVVLIAIVRCTTEARDVFAFLSALPPLLLVPSLAALRQLLTSDTSRHHWPQPCISTDWRESAALLAAAMPTFHSVSLHCGLPNAGQHSGWRTVAPPISDFTQPYCAFVARWATKVERLVADFNSRSEYDDEYFRLLRMCTNLRRVVVFGSPCMLEAVTTETHCVSELTILSNRDWNDSVVRNLARWLASGHAVYLRLNSWDATSDAGMARALAMSPTLSHLVLEGATAIIAGLVANGLVLRYITHLDLTPGTHVEALLPLIDLNQLTTLKLRARAGERRDVSYLLPALSRMTALNELELVNVSINEMPAIPPPLAVRIQAITLDRVTFSMESRRVLLHWAMSSSRLQHLSWPNSTSAEQGFNGEYLCTCILAGVHTIDFDWMFSARDAAVLATAIRGATAPRSATLHIHQSAFRRPSVEYLRRALATCFNVRVVIAESGDMLQSPVAALPDP